MSDRTTLADNFTGNHTRIELIAKTLLSPPDEAWSNLQEMGADYIVVFVAGQRINQGQNEALYLLNGGGDESKKQWFMRIAGEPLQKYIHPDGSSGTDYFWNNTLLGKLFPFSPLAYIDPNNTESQFQTWKPGLTPVYEKDIKYPTTVEGPFRLVHGSPSFVNEDIVFIGVFVYEINDNYIP